MRVHALLHMSYILLQDMQPLSQSTDDEQQQSYVPAPGTTSADAYAEYQPGFLQDPRRHQRVNDDHQDGEAWANQGADAGATSPGATTPGFCDPDKLHQQVYQGVPLLGKQESTQGYSNSRGIHSQGDARQPQYANDNRIYGYSDVGQHAGSEFHPPHSAYMSQFWHNAGFLVPAIGFILILAAFWGSVKPRQPSLERTISDQAEAPLDLQLSARYPVQG